MYTARQRRRAGTARSVRWEKRDGKMEEEEEEDGVRKKEKRDGGREGGGRERERDSGKEWNAVREGEEGR